MGQGKLDGRARVSPESNRWVIGGLDHPMPPFDFIDHPHPAGLDVSVAAEGATLGELLVAGEIDALSRRTFRSPFWMGPLG